MKLSTWSAAGWGAVMGLLVFLESLLFGGLRADSIQVLPILPGLGALIGVEWNELHFLERYGTGGFFARWALAGMSVGATVFGVGRAGEGWPWWGLFGALALGGGLGMAVGLEWGGLLGDPPWQKDRQVGGGPDAGLLRIDWPPKGGGASSVASPQERRRADSEPDDE